MKAILLGAAAAAFFALPVLACNPTPAQATSVEAYASAAPANAAPAALAQAVKVDENLPVYGKAVEGISGTIKSAGSDTMSNLMTTWQEGFQKLYPSVKIEIESKGSATAPTALIEGTATLGAMSREMKAKEVDDFEKKFGYKPVALSTSIDMLAVYVHKDNPLAGLTLQQCDAIFSKTRKGGLEKDIQTWADLGVTGDLAMKKISLYGRNSASGTYGYFKEHALFNGDFKDGVKEQPGSSAVVQGVATDPVGIGYSGIGYKTADVKAVPLASDANSPKIPATPENAYSGEYALSRFLLVYVNRAPGKELDPLPREFVRYIFSQEGQKDVVKEGFYPVTADVARQMLAAAGIESGAVNAGYGKK